MNTHVLKVVGLCVIIFGFMVVSYQLVTLQKSVEIQAIKTQEVQMRELSNSKELVQLEQSLTPTPLVMKTLKK